MVEKKSSSRVIDTWKQKKWYKILSPPLFGSRPVGDTMAIEDQQVVGRTVNISLAAVTGDVKKQSVNVSFEVTSVKNGAAETILKRLEIAPSSIRRLVRKGKNRIDLSFVCATQDNAVVRVKPFLVTRAKVGGAVLTKIRRLLEDVVRVETHKLSFETLAHDILTGRLQKSIKQRINRVYPLKICEIRSVEKTVATKPLPPIPTLPEWKEETVEETEEEKIEKKVKAKAAEIVEVVEEKAEKKPKARKAKAEATEEA